MALATASTTLLGPGRRLLCPLNKRSGHRAAVVSCRAGWQGGSDTGGWRQRAAAAASCAAARPGRSNSFEPPPPPPNNDGGSNGGCGGGDGSGGSAGRMEPGAWVRRNRLALLGTYSFLMAQFVGGFILLYSELKATSKMVKELELELKTELKDAKRELEDEIKDAKRELEDEIKVVNTRLDKLMLGNNTSGGGGAAAAS